MADKEDKAKPSAHDIALKWVTSLVLPLTIFLLGTAFTQQQQKNNSERLNLDKLALQQKERADREMEMMKYLASDEVRQRILALHIMNAFAKGNLVDTFMMQSVLPAFVTDTAQEIRTALAIVVPDLIHNANTRVSTMSFNLFRNAARKNEHFAQELNAIANADTNIARRMPARIYLHIADDSLRPLASQIAEALKRQGYIVPGIENVSKKWRGFTKTDFRYFRDEDKSLAVDTILPLLAGAFAEIKPTVKYVEGYEKRNTRRYFELNLGNDIKAERGPSQ
jgi:signal transduction histidine kinase